MKRSGERRQLATKQPGTSSPSVTEARLSCPRPFWIGSPAAHSGRPGSSLGGSAVLREVQPWEEPQGAGVVPVVAAGCRLDMSAGGGASAVVGRALGGASEEGWARRRRTARGKGRGARRVAPRFLPWAQPAFRAPTQSQAASSP